MKFGETLHQRSIPQWSNYNVDYNDLKQLIKERTSERGATNPVTIPGHGNAAVGWARLEDELFPILCQQHERVNLFTRSKYGEFERRLDYVDRQARSLTRQNNESSSRPVQHTRRYGKLAREVDSVSEDIQSLSRYVTMQKQAFRKILKKYQKWTASSGLEHRMNNKVFNQPTSMLSLDFSCLLDRLGGVKANLTAFSQPEGGGDQKSTGERKCSPRSSPQPRSSASHLHDVFLHSSQLEFDAAFSALPLGMAGGRATYWVHKDNLEEVTVLMRRYMRNRRGSIASPTPRTGSNTSLSTAQADEILCTTSKDRTHIAMFDNLQRFVQAHGAVTVGQTEAVVGSVSTMLAMSILWADQPEAIVMTSDLSPVVVPAHRPVDIMPISSKSLVKLFAADALAPSAVSTESKKASSASGYRLQTCRDWLAQNRDVKPLAEIQCTRSRFAGLNNTSEVGTWALMDRDITMSPPDSSTVGHGGLDGLANAQQFPYTVIEVRWEFSRTPEIVRALNSTHLVERVRGFSLEAQVIKAVCKPADMPLPMWQPLLDQDIRKVPPIQARSTLRRNWPTMAASGPSSTDLDPSAGTSSATATQGSVTSPPESRRSTPPTTPLSSRGDMPESRRVRKPKSSYNPVRHTRRAPQRYWNEFDDGDEFREQQSYAIYVKPDEEMSVPGAETVAKAFSSMYQSLGRTKRRLVSWLPLPSRGDGRDEEVEQGIRRPLLRRTGTDQEEDESSDSEPLTQRSKATNQRRPSARYGTADHRSTSLSQTHHGHGHGPRPARPSREIALLRTYLGCYAIAFVLLIMSSIMRATGRHKAQVEVEAGVIVGVIAALGSAIMAISLMMSREERLSWLHRCLGGGGFLLIVAWGAWLVLLVSRSLS